LSGLLTHATSLASARDEFAAAAKQGAGGREAMARLAARVDDIVRELAAAAGPHAAGPVAVCALGGYGRRALSLHSDIDLLILFSGGVGHAEARYVNALLQPLWDLRLAVGHHVRELADFEDPDPANIEFLLAMLDARVIAGDAHVFDALPGRFRSSASRDRLLRAALPALVRERHRRFNDTPYHLEPDVKDAPGGLRDLAALRALRAVAPDAIEAADRRRVDQLNEAEDFLLRIRALIHADASRNVNVFTHDLQERASEILARAAGTPEQRVEAMMSEYFGHARNVTRTLAAALTVLEGPVTPSAGRRLSKRLELAADGVRLATVSEAASRPAAWIETFREALAKNLPVSHDLLRSIEHDRARFLASDFVATEAERRQLRALLFPRPGLYARLSEMHDCGLLGSIFPEFDKIRSRVIRDFCHKYTVDEHTLLAIRNIELLRSATTPSQQRFKSLLDEVHSPELLTLALLFHDVGKWHGEDHVRHSLALLGPMFDRLQLPDEDRRTVEFLIRHHLEMSRVAFRQDTEDPDVVRRFAALVGNEDRLKMLCLLTRADVGAVSSDTLTPWKEELLWRLYVDTYNHLTLEYGDQLIQKDRETVRRLVESRPPDVDEAELTVFLNGLPSRYLSLFDAGTVYKHVRLARHVHADEVHTTLERRSASHDAWELTVVTSDKPFLFSNIAGVLSYFGMDIHRGQALTTPDGLVLDVFQFTDREKYLRHNAGAPSEISRALQAVVSGTVDVPALLGGKTRSIMYRRRRRVRPVVSVDNEHSRKYTVIEIVGDDGIGVLYRISRAISARGCNVHLALISTESGKVTDVLHVTKDGNQLTASDRADLSHDLERALEETHEAHQEHRATQQGR
jgi:[protein-PII] uridylyltransferase